MSLSSQCAICPNRSRIVPPDGPQPSRVMFIGEGPAKQEVRYGRPFAGQSGRELDNQYCPMAGLDRYQCRVANVMGCALPGFRNPELDEAQRCANACLPREIRYTGPEIIVTLGAIACEVLFPDCDLSLAHGLPRPARLWDWEGIHVPIYHPAAGLHEQGAAKMGDEGESGPNYAVLLQQDFSNLGEIQRGRFVMPVDEYPDPVYRAVESADDLRSILGLRGAFEPGAELGQDTEVVSLAIREPWCLSFSLAPGTGYVIRADRPEIVSRYARYIQEYRPLTIFHNALFDLDIDERMGITVSRWMDTMQRAYNLMSLPQGLKALSYRLCGMKMESFTDLVLPYARGEVLDYLHGVDARLVSLGWEPPVKARLPRGTSKEARAARDEEYKETRAAFMEDPLTTGARKLRRLISDMETGEKNSVTKFVNPWRRWKEWDEEERAALSTIMGSEIPSPSITQVPFDKAVHYASRDADATLRAARVLRREAARFRREA